MDLKKKSVFKNFYCYVLADEPFKKKWFGFFGAEAYKIISAILVTIIATIVTTFIIAAIQMESTQVEDDPKFHNSSSNGGEFNLKQNISSNTGEKEYNDLFMINWQLY